MKNKTALITGGASGIGRASAIAFVKAGANIFVIDINESEAKIVIDEIMSFGGNALYYKADVSNENEVLEAISYCIE